MIIGKDMMQIMTECLRHDREKWNEKSRTANKIRFFTQNYWKKRKGRISRMSQGADFLMTFGSPQIQEMASARYPVIKSQVYIEDPTRTSPPMMTSILSRSYSNSGRQLYTSRWRRDWRWHERWERCIQVVLGCIMDSLTEGQMDGGTDRWLDILRKLGGQFDKFQA